MQSSSGTNVKKSRRSKREVAIENLKKIKDRRRKPDWVRLEKYKANRLAGMNRFQSAINAGFPYSTARHNSHKIDRLTNIDIKTALEDAGATNKVMASSLVDLARNATKRQNCTVEVRSEDGEIIVDDKAAELVPDNHLRKESWELIAKLKKQLGSNQLIPDEGYKRLIIVVEKEDEPKNEKDPISQNGESDRRDNQVDKAPELRVEVVD